MNEDLAFKSLIGARDTAARQVNLWEKRLQHAQNCVEYWKLRERTYGQSIAFLVREVPLNMIATPPTEVDDGHD